MGLRGRGRARGSPFLAAETPSPPRPVCATAGPKDRRPWANGSAGRSPQGPRPLPDQSLYDPAAPGTLGGTYVSGREREDHGWQLTQPGSPSGREGWPVSPLCCHYMQRFGAMASYLTSVTHDSDGRTIRTLTPPLRPARA